MCVWCVILSVVNDGSRPCAAKSMIINSMKIRTKDCAPHFQGNLTFKLRTTTLALSNPVKGIWLLINKV